MGLEEDLVYKKEFPLDICSVNFLHKALIWAESFNKFSFFQGADFNIPYKSFPTMLFVGETAGLQKRSGDPFESLKDFLNNNKKWLSGYFAYDLKNYIEALTSTNPDYIHYTDMEFSVPEALIFFNTLSIHIISYKETCDKILKTIENTSLPEILPIPHCSFKIIPEKEDYINIVNNLKKHIVDGNTYEINYCIRFFCENIILNPLELFLILSKKSPSSFSVIQKIDEKYSIGASPERFLKKEGNKLIAQPIKGTSPRSANSVIDRAFKENILTSEKELAEHMMILDLVRNDLAKSAQPGTVKVEELFGIYTFPSVHQMISTITATLKTNVNGIDALKNAFPMGSMTGAPKIKSMELIESYETFKRSLFSGAIGYITPTGDYDFNVVIRTLFYNSKSGSLNYFTGSAITYDSHPEEEYAECLLKAQVIIDLLK